MLQIAQDNRKTWNSFVLHNGGSFLQSFEWGAHQSFFRKDWLKLKINPFDRLRVNAEPCRSIKSMPRTLRHNAGVVRGQKSKVKNQNSNLNGIVIQASLFKQRLPLGFHILYCPRGPVMNMKIPVMQYSQALFELLRKIKDIAKQEKVIFLRIEPEWEDTEKNRKILQEAGFVKSQKEIQPTQTQILNIVKSEEELLRQMHSKTRYNIRLAQKHGIRVQILNPKSQIPNKFQIQNSNNQNHFEAFWKLLQQTAQRDKFRTHPQDYYKKMLEIPFVQLFLAEYKNKIIAGNIVVFFGKRAVYLHGASDYNHRNLMAPHLLQWEQIKEAKKQGCAEYDFWGIDERKWPGLTRFKKGFGGEMVNYIGAWDLVFDKNLYKIYEALTKIKKYVRII